MSIQITDQYDALTIREVQNSLSLEVANASPIHIFFYMQKCKTKSTVIKNMSFCFHWTTKRQKKNKNNLSSCFNMGISNLYSILCWKT